jgi:hypothetical protein
MRRLLAGESGRLLSVVRFRHGMAGHEEAKLSFKQSRGPQILHGYRKRVFTRSSNQLVVCTGPVVDKDG